MGVPVPMTKATFRRGRRLLSDVLGGGSAPYVLPDWAFIHETFNDYDDQTASTTDGSEYDKGVGWTDVPTVAVTEGRFPVAYDYIEDGYTDGVSPDGINAGEGFVAGWVVG